MKKGSWGGVVAGELGPRFDVRRAWAGGQRV